MADAIAEATGRHVAFVDVPPQAFAGALSAAGVPPWQVDGLTEDYAHYARGEAEAISPHVREVTASNRMTSECLPGTTLAPSRGSDAGGPVR